MIAYKYQYNVPVTFIVKFFHSSVKVTKSAKTAFFVVIHKPPP